MKLYIQERYNIFEELIIQQVHVLIFYRGVVLSNRALAIVRNLRFQSFGVETNIEYLTQIHGVLYHHS